MSYQVKRLFEVVAIFGAFLVFSVIMIGVGSYFYFSPIIANKTALMNNNSTGLTLLDRNGDPFFTFYEAKNSEYTTLPEISDHVEQAVVAVEDKEFYKHNGISLRGIVRSLARNIEEGDMSFGGSTITQQLVKNTLLSPEKSLIRKLKEAVLAQEVERRYSKDEILEMYLNSVYFGRGAFGIEHAASAYFGKSASDLNLAEASFLVGILPAPSNADSDAARKRQKYVLEELLNMGNITDTQKADAEITTLTFSNSSDEINVLAPHFALMVRDELIEKYGEEVIVRSGFTVKTTLDPEWQIYAEETVRKNVASLSSSNVTNGAAVVMVPESGEVRALVGSADWYDSRIGKVNMATSPRQPGSSFKPFVYGLALESGSITPATVLRDDPLTIRIEDCRFNCIYQPKNYDGRFRGRVTVRRALANSLNVPAVRVMQKVGVHSVVSKAQDLGINTLNDPENYGPSLVLGAGEVPLIEMTQAYAAFANEGEMVSAKLYTEIENKSGKVISNNMGERRRVWSEGVSYLISSILSDNRARAETFGNALSVSRPAAVKTGTTDNYRDAWTLGYTPTLAVGVWVGNNYNEPMSQIAGSLGAAPIWRELMEEFSRGTPVMTFEIPDSVVRLASCRGGVQESEASQSAMFEYFISGTQPSRSCFRIPGDIAASGSGTFEAGIGGAPSADDVPSPGSVSENQQQQDDNNNRDEEENDGDNTEEKESGNNNDFEIDIVNDIGQKENEGESSGEH